MLPLFIEPNDLQKCIQNSPSDLIIIDLGKEARFNEAHIPNAILVTPAETQAPAPVPGLLPSQEALTHLMRRIGLTASSHVVVYDDEGGGWAGRFIWMLDEIGHTRYSYLNGGLISWKAENLPMASGMSTNTCSNLSIEVNHKHTIQCEALWDVLNTANTLVWDARSPLEYKGEKVFSARGGHIPNAINYEWTRAMDIQNHHRLKPLDQLEAELAELGITRDKDIYTHCQSHHRSGLTYLIAKLLKFPSVKAYAGSWGEWGNRQDTPIES